MLSDDPATKHSLVNYREDKGGNQALHFAVSTGNRSIIDILLNLFKYNPKTPTANGLSAMHCSAQNDKGVLSMIML
jgi:ankyrin repeat protein